MRSEDDVDYARSLVVNALNSTDAKGNFLMVALEVLNWVLDDSSNETSFHKLQIRLENTKRYGTPEEKQQILDRIRARAARQ